MQHHYPVLRSDSASVRLPVRLGQANPVPVRARDVRPTTALRHRASLVVRTLFPAFFALSLASVAHAQGTMDFSGAQMLMGTFKTFAMYAGAVICLGGLIFAGIRMMSGRFQDAIPGLFGALFGAGVLG